MNATVIFLQTLNLGVPNEPKNSLVSITPSEPEDTRPSLPEPVPSVLASALSSIPLAQAPGECLNPGAPNEPKSLLVSPTPCNPDRAGPPQPEPASPLATAFQAKRWNGGMIHSLPWRGVGITMSFVHAAVRWGRWFRLPRPLAGDSFSCPSGSG